MRGPVSTSAPKLCCIACTGTFTKDCSCLASRCFIILPTALNLLHNACSAALPPRRRRMPAGVSAAGLGISCFGPALSPPRLQPCALHLDQVRLQVSKIESSGVCSY